MSLVFALNPQGYTFTLLGKYISAVIFLNNKEETKMILLRIINGNDKDNWKRVYIDVVNLEFVEWNKTTMTVTRNKIRD